MWEHVSPPGLQWIRPIEQIVHAVDPVDEQVAPMRRPRQNALHAFCFLVNIPVLLRDRRPLDRPAPLHIPPVRKHIEQPAEEELKERQGLAAPQQQEEVEGTFQGFLPTDDLRNERRVGRRKRWEMGIGGREGRSGQTRD